MRDLRGIGKDRPGDAIDSRHPRAQLDAVLLEPSAVDLEQLDLDHDFGPPLVDDPHDPLGGRDLVGGVVDGEGVRPGQGRDPARPEHDPQQVDGFFQVGIGQEQGLDRLLLELAPLLGSVGNDGQHMRVHHPVERVPRGAERVQGLVEGDVLEIEGHGLVLELRVEDEVDARGLAECDVGLAQGRPAKVETERFLGRGRRARGRAAPARVPAP